MFGPHYPALLALGGFHWPGLMARYTDARLPIPYHCGYGVGGSSAINAQIAIRPVPSDFEVWPTGWRWDDVLPFFIKLETDCDFGDEGYHGSSGPIPILREPTERWGAVDVALAEAAAALGHRWCADYNAPASTGVSPIASNIRDGRRVSTNDAYLEPARDRSNLRIVGDARVDRVLITNGRAEGVRVRLDGEWTDWRADEIVLAAGALGSPAILMRSGLGDATHLRSVGIEPVLHIPGIGTNLQEHPRVLVGLVLREHGRSDPNAVRGFSCYVRFTSSAGVENDLLWHCASHTGRGNEFGVAVAGLMAPTSTGSLRLASPDPTDNPIINFRLDSTREDQSRLRELARQTFELLDRPEMATITESATAGTSRRSIADLRDDEALDTWIAEECIEFHHPCGTCKMGDPDHPDVVVDRWCNVVGIDRLRVADASIFPNIPRANTNLAAIMVGEHAAALVANE